VFGGEMLVEYPQHWPKPYMYYPTHDHTR